MKRLSSGKLDAYLSAFFNANKTFWRTVMIHVGADVHVRNTVLRAKDSEGEVLAS